MPEIDEMQDSIESIAVDMLKQLAYSSQEVSQNAPIPARFVQHLSRTLQDTFSLYKQGKFDDEEVQHLAGIMSRYLEILKHDIDYSQESMPYVIKEVEVYNANHADSQFEESSLLRIASNIALESVTDEQLETLVPEIVDKIFLDADKIMQSGAISNIIEILKRAAKSIQSNEKRKLSRAETVASRQKAENSGAIMSLQNKLTFFSSDELRHAHTGMTLKLLPTESGDLVNLFDCNGELNKYALSQMLNKYDQSELQPMTEIHAGFVGAVLNLAKQTVCNDNSQDALINFCLTPIFSEMKIDGRFIDTQCNGQKISRKEARAQVLMLLCRPFENVVARLPNGSYYRFLSFVKYDADTDTATLSAPAILKMLSIALNADQPKMNELIHADAANERNQSAVEIANYILVTMKQRGNRGTDKGGKVSVKLKFSTIIENCTNISAEIEDIRNSTVKDEKTGKEIKSPQIRQKLNAKLKQTFSAAYRIIIEKSDAAKEFQNLKFMPFNEKAKTIITPTQSTLDKCIVISWTAKKSE